MTCRRSILRLAHRHHSRESIPHFGFSVLFGIPSCPSTLASSTFGSVVACLWFSSLPWLFDGQWTYKSIRVTLCLGGLVWIDSHKDHATAQSLHVDPPGPLRCWDDVITRRRQNSIVNQLATAVDCVGQTVTQVLNRRMYQVDNREQITGHRFDRVRHEKQTNLT